MDTTFYSCFPLNSQVCSCIQNGEKDNFTSFILHLSHHCTLEQIKPLKLFTIRLCQSGLSGHTECTELTELKHGL